MDGGARLGGRAAVGNPRLTLLVLGLLAGSFSAWPGGPGDRLGLPRGARSSGPEPTEIRAYLPPNEESGAWTRDGDFREFAGEDLYLYIDGGAAIYQEYGFVRAITQDYKTRGGQGLSLEIFEMETQAGAYGMFTFKRSAAGEVIPAGADGQLEDYYLNFWKGNFLVTLTSFDKDERGQRQLVQMALAVARRIPDSAAQRPFLVDRLPQFRLLGTSVRYFRGNLGFMNCFPSAVKGGYQIQEGVRGDYSSGARLFILRYSGPEEARARLAAIEKAFRGGGEFRDCKSLDGLFSAIDETGNKVTLRIEGRHFLICIEDASGQEASRLFAATAKTLR
jgi:hypothetical protein